MDNNAAFYEWAYGVFSGVCPVRVAIGLKDNDALPDEFLTMSVIAETPTAHYSNRMKRTRTRVSLTYYTRDSSTMASKMQLILDTGIANGLRFVGASGDRYYPDTQHYARSADFHYHKEVNNE